MQEGDNDDAIPFLERAVALDPLYLPAASTLIGLYQKQGKTAEAEALSTKIEAAMTQTSDADQTAQNGASSEPPKKTEEVFKNIQVLKGIPSGQLIPTMEFISSSLGVECSYCHVQDHFESDDKKPKQTARVMMQMMFAIDQNNFEGRREVTCYSCHRGAATPVGAPDIAGEMQTNIAATASEAPELPAGLPSVSEPPQLRKSRAAWKRAPPWFAASRLALKSSPKRRINRRVSSIFRMEIALAFSTARRGGLLFRTDQRGAWKRRT